MSCDDHRRSDGNKTILITGFGPFAATDDNPSAHIARALPWAETILPVSFAAVDDWIEALKENPPQVLVSLGYANRSLVSYERVAKNAYGPQPDVDGQVRSGVILPGSTDLSGTLWQPDLTPQFKPELEAWSDDAGTYLCNYIYFQAITKLSNCKVGFVHVPAFTFVPLNSAKDLIENAIRLSL